MKILLILIPLIAYSGYLFYTKNSNHEPYVITPSEADIDIDSLWEEWKLIYNKQYSSPEEEF